jgi:hypothetical protein
MVGKGLTGSFECAVPSEAKLKILAVLKVPRRTTSWGAHMDVLGILGFVFALTATGRLAYERQSDVLHGPYIEGRVRTRGLASIICLMRAVVNALMEHLNWQARNAIYLASLA